MQNKKSKLNEIKTLKYFLEKENLKLTKDIVFDEIDETLSLKCIEYILQNMIERYENEILKKIYPYYKIKAYSIFLKKSDDKGEEVDRNYKIVEIEKMKKFIKKYNPNFLNYIPELYYMPPHYLVYGIHRQLKLEYDKLYELQKKYKNKYKKSEIEKIDEMLLLLAIDVERVFDGETELFGSKINLGPRIINGVRFGGISETVSRMIERRRLEDSIKEEEKPSISKIALEIIPSIYSHNKKPNENFSEDSVKEEQSIYSYNKKPNENFSEDSVKEEQSIYSYNKKPNENSLEDSIKEELNQNLFEEEANKLLLE